MKFRFCCFYCNKLKILCYCSKCKKIVCNECKTFSFIKNNNKCIKCKK